MQKVLRVNGCTKANCANTKGGRKKKPLMSVMLLYFSSFPSYLSRPPVSLFHQRGKEGTAWCSDELAGFRGGDASEGAIMAFDKCA